MVAVVAQHPEALGIAVLAQPPADLLSDGSTMCSAATVHVIDDEEDDGVLVTARASPAVVLDRC
jgi:hypothetical protein